MTAKKRCRFPWKIAYPHKTDALAALADLHRKDGARRMDAYRCAGHWHIGHRPIGRRRQW